MNVCLGEYNHKKMPHASKNGGFIPVFGESFTIAKGPEPLNETKKQKLCSAFVNSKIFLLPGREE